MSCDCATKYNVAAEIAKLIALQQFTRFGEGLKYVQVYSPWGYFGSVTVELAEIPSPAACTAVAEKIATMSRPTVLARRLQPQPLNVSGQPMQRSGRLNR